MEYPKTRGRERVICHIIPNCRPDRGEKQCLSNTIPLQFMWDKPGVDSFLMKSTLGREAVEILNKYEKGVHMVGDLHILRTYPDKRVEKIGVGGIYKPGGENIIIDQDLTNEQASTVFVHEVTHLNQHKENVLVVGTNFSLAEKHEPLLPFPFPDALSKELDAHRKQEEYRKEAGLPGNPLFLDGDQISDAKIEAYVKKNYSPAADSGPAAFQDSEFLYESLKIIRPWSKPVGVSE